MAAIAEELSTGAYDVVSLQEVWSTHDFDLIRGRTSDVLPYAHYFHRCLVYIYKKNIKRDCGDRRMTCGGRH